MSWNQCRVWLLFSFISAATPEFYTLSLHDALPIYDVSRGRITIGGVDIRDLSFQALSGLVGDRKSTRLNSSHRCISYAVFCLKKKRWTGAAWSSASTTWSMTAVTCR